MMHDNFACQTGRTNENFVRFGVPTSGGSPLTPRPDATHRLGSFRKTFAVPRIDIAPAEIIEVFSHWLRSVKTAHGAHCHPATHCDVALASASCRRLPPSLKLHVFHSLASFRNFYCLPSCAPAPRFPAHDLPPTMPGFRNHAAAQRK